MRWGFVVGVFLLLGSLVSATYIQLSTTVMTESIVTANETQINVTLKNTGDESAYDIQLSLVLPDGFSSKDIYIGTLPPEEPSFNKFNVSIGDVLPGRYPIAIKVNYADSNRYPFSTLSSGLLVYREPSGIGVHGTLSHVGIAGKEKKEVVMTIRNIDDVAHNVDVWLFLPNELKSDTLSKKVRVGARSVEEEKFIIESFGALPGSTYVVTAAMSYEKNGLMHASLAGGIVKILEESETKKTESNSTMFILVGVLVILILLFLYLRK